MGYVFVHVSIFRAAVLIAVAALLAAVLGPLLQFGWVSPKFAIIGVVLAVSRMRELQAVLLGFFGGILIDALGGGLFGVGALGGLIAGFLAVRVGAARLKSAERLLLAQTVGISVAAYDVISWTAFNLAGLDAPPMITYVFVGMLPDALLNAVLAYLLAGWLTRIVRVREVR